MILLNGELKHLPGRETVLLASSVPEPELCKNAFASHRVGFPINSRQLLLVVHLLLHSESRPWEALLCGDVIA